MTGYTFITLDVNVKAPLIAHLKEACGVEVDDKMTIAELQDAILEFEENNSLERPNELLPARLKTQDPIVPAMTTVKEDIYIPISQRPRKNVVVTNNLDSEATDEYFQINEYKVRIVFGQEVSIPDAMINHIKNIKKTEYKQEKDTSITPVVRPCYGIEEKPSQVTEG
ncbi:hypothetical protein ACF8PD_13590 [Vibrio plantisponsor]|uniref:hypothetical protein n=1 Tax=Vibrio plantisponsor TaxID=664643 RepID=UPI00370C03A7